MGLWVWSYKPLIHHASLDQDGIARKAIYPHKYSMLLDHLFEDAEADTRRSRLAYDFINELYGFLYNHSVNGSEIDDVLERVKIGSTGAYQYCIRPSEFGAPPVFRQVLLAFRHDDIPDVSGSANVLQTPWNGLHYLVTMDADTRSLSGILRSINSTEGRTTLHHELQHVLDYRRFKRPEAINNREIKDAKVKFQAATKDAISADEIDGHRKEYLKVYHNDNLEMNAFFHNLAEPVLSRLRFFLKNDFVADQLFPRELTRDFREYLKDTVASKQWGIVAQHWSNISEPNKRKVISRLKKLFDLYWEMKDKYDQTNEVTD